LPAESTAQDIEETVRFLANDPDMHGIIIQLPLPKAHTDVNADDLIALIPPTKDVDGLRKDWQNLTYTSARFPDLIKPQEPSLPPIVGSVFSLLDWYGIDISGKKLVTVGNGRLVGQPVAAFARLLGEDVQTVDDETENIFDITRQADVIVTGTGQPDLVTYQWLKQGAVVVNCANDVHEDSVSEVAEALSPATGGIGPLTVAWLLHNVAQAAYRNA
jgi:methylenetetrahydrofolate dehydrogenase (NADP+)/methenyltetrahydrofolate cyclohydrolase